MLIPDGWFPGPVTMTLIDSCGQTKCGQTESGMGGLWYREIPGEIMGLQFSRPTGAMALKLEREYTHWVFRSTVSVPIRTVPVMPLVR